MLHQLKLILDKPFRIWCGQYQPTQLYLYHCPTKLSFSWFAQVRARAWAIAHTSCQDLPSSCIAVGGVAILQILQQGFFTNSVADLLPTLDLLGGLYTFCNLVIMFSLMQITMTCKKVSYFTDLEMVKYYQKRCGWNSKSSKTNDYVRNYARYTKLKIISFGVWRDV